MKRNVAQHKNYFFLVLIQLLLVGIVVALNAPVYLSLFLLILWVYPKALPFISTNEQLSFYPALCYSFVGIYSVLYLKEFLNPVFAASLITLILSYTKININNLAVIYASSFTAMSPWLTWIHPLSILAPWIIVSTLFILLNQYVGVGGKLGSIGLFASMVLYFISN